MPKLNQKGFAAIEGILIIVILAIVGGTGYFVYHSNKKTNDTLNSAAKVAQSSPSKVTKKKATITSTRQYLTIKEWGVKLPLSGADMGAYYTPPVPDQLGQDIALFDTNIDNLNNSNGVNCKDDGFPLFVMTRLKTGDLATSTNVNSPNFMVETNATMFKTFSFDKSYVYSGVGFHQAPPQCLDLTPSATNMTPDPNVDAKYTVVKQAFESSFNKLQQAN